MNRSLLITRLGLLALAPTLAACAPTPPAPTPVTEQLAETQRLRR